MTFLVTGAAGMLGRAVLRRLGPAGAGIDLPDGDLTDPAAVSDVFTHHHPAWVIHCAAFTDVDGAEDQRERARAVNATATGHLAYACEQSGAGLSYVSTDYVFDGSAAEGYAEDAPRRPINHYGATKAEGERVVETLSVPWQIVRTSWLFGHGPKHFPGTVRRLLRERETVRVVNDQRGSPTYSEDLAAVLVCLARARARGVFHATNAGVCTWWEFAREIARRDGHDPQRVVACSSDEFPTAARRPACSVLLDTRLAETGCPAAPPWQDALARYIAATDLAGPDPAAAGAG
ncbi:MAG: dTDP-4-dehydrorhamnose reductase [Candidatus Krumholzibacteriia bacterium]